MDELLSWMLLIGYSRDDNSEGGDTRSFILVASPFKKKYTSLCRNPIPLVFRAPLASDSASILVEKDQPFNRSSFWTPKIKKVKPHAPTEEIFDFILRKVSHQSLQISGRRQRDRLVSRKAITMKSIVAYLKLIGDHRKEKGHTKAKYMESKTLADPRTVACSAFQGHTSSGLAASNVPGQKPGGKGSKNINLPKESIPSHSSPADRPKPKGIFRDRHIEVHLMDGRTVRHLFNENTVSADLILWTSTHIGLRDSEWFRIALKINPDGDEEVFLGGDTRVEDLINENPDPVLFMKFVTFRWLEREPRYNTDLVFLGLAYHQAMANYLTSDFDKEVPEVVRSAAIKLKLDDRVLGDPNDPVNVMDYIPNQGVPARTENEWKQDVIAEFGRIEQQSLNDRTLQFEFLRMADNWIHGNLIRFSIDHLDEPNWLGDGRKELWINKRYWNLYINGQRDRTLGSEHHMATCNLEGDVLILESEYNGSSYRLRIRAPAVDVIDGVIKLHKGDWTSLQGRSIATESEQ